MPFKDTPADDLTVLSTALAIWLSKVLTLEDLIFLGNFIVSTGGIMLSIATQEEAITARKQSLQLDIQTQIAQLQKQLEELEKRLPPPP